MLPMLIPAITGIISTVIDKAIPDKGEAERLKASLTLKVMELNASELKSATSVILAEAQGESWLQRNWRPLMMVWFAGLVGAHWFGLTPENLSPEAISQLFDIVQLGVGGYILGRSGEKIVKKWKEQ